MLWRQCLEGSFESGSKTFVSGKFHSNEDLKASEEELHSMQLVVYSFYFLK
jgi:hypothetical protein